MSYVIAFADGFKSVNETAVSAYKVLDSGVLQTIEQEDHPDKTWTVTGEYSPGAWNSVEGTRWIGETKNMRGDGVIVNGEYKP